MSIEVMYPSRSQSRAQNPLFARRVRRQQLALMLVATAIGLGLLLFQFVPITAHANVAASAEGKSAPVAAIAPIKAAAPSGKAVRLIPIYTAAN
jgi:hypothetical protein